MTLARHTRPWLLILTAVFVAGLLVLLPLAYPVRVHITFDYKGQRHTTSFVTLMRIGICDPKECTFFRWDPDHTETSMSLRDGSLLTLGTDWPLSGRMLRDGIQYRTTVRWVWLDDRSVPTQYVSADSASRLSPNRSGQPAFVWVSASAMVERLGAFSLFAGARPNVSDQVLYAINFGRSHTDIGGQLLIGVEAVPLKGEGLAQLKKSNGWVTTTSGCRVLFRTPASRSTVSAGVVRDVPQSRLLLHHDDVWSADDGPRPGEVFIGYAAGSVRLDHAGVIRGVSGEPFGGLVMQRLHAVEFGGKICGGIEWPQGSYGAYLDFGDGQIIGLFSSMDFVVVRE